ncbi:alanine racemase [Candidatus Collierbacteria bacterium RIFCSPLOWO2_01_FULL_50_23]|uniref:Alanine racemase n=2 Tax=Candidatus Collieribacteriota TaxID=1752725 RepID=A0A1F5ESF6_9BACT|nr:MAG: alanine racemase [Candidatus Collierbacteria bacterium RIFCSPHIGHO2_02_FULL_49_10]OGD71891.1 MAG: alanine racemase [Candidatus Collierbacteria bacterium RIFCSPHIGHO2_01_FULL_50_25]OGD74754.1 MAG: alanine racemase [Candidatus Collierbacteria bacterium RIFCSPLOWO2_01_FULL_50_23]
MTFPKAVINLRYLTHNLRQIKKAISQQTKIMAVVKANAYGHGLLPITRHLHHQGINYFGVARLEEALAIRRLIKDATILVLSPIPEENFPDAVKERISLTVSDQLALKQLNNIARRAKTKALVHLKIDTGLHRSGLAPDEVTGFIKVITNQKNVILEGVFTHFANADSDNRFTQKQLGLFREIALPIKRLFPHTLLHTAASSAIFRFKESHFDLVRPGLALYGHISFTSPKINLKPILALTTRISRIHRVQKNETIGYDRTYTTKRKLTVATLMMGYADGLRRAPLSWPQVLIRNKSAPIVGRISMDQSVVDVSRIKPTPSAKSTVLLLDDRSDSLCSLEAIAKKIGTSPYEVLVDLSENRVHRIYIHGKVN